MRSTTSHLDQLLLRAIVYRLTTESVLRAGTGTLEAVVEARAPLAEVVLRRTAGRPPLALEDLSKVGWAPPGPAS